MAINTAPDLTGLAPSITFAENTVNATPQLLDADVTFTDPDNNFDGGRLIVQGLLEEDIVSIRNQGTGDGEISLEGDIVSYGGTVIGTVSGEPGASLFVDFNAAATSAAVEALFENLTYANTSDAPIATRNLSITVVDAAGAYIPTHTQEFTVQTGDANPFDGVDVGFTSAPSFADLDGDGDLDAVVGDYFGSLRTFLNTGEAGSPVFTLQTGSANPFFGVDVGNASTPAFADLDGDGDPDAVVGDSNGLLRTFLNTGDFMSPAFTEQTGDANPFDGVNVGGYSAPAFADLDGDGDLDAVVGGYYGTLSTFLNTGDFLSPMFTAQTGAANPFDGVDVGVFAAPTFADIDGDGDPDAVVGDINGLLHTFLNTGDVSSPVFTELTGEANPFDGVDVGDVATPAFADIDRDGHPDVVVGEEDGFLNTFLDTGPDRDISITVTVTPEADNAAPTLAGFAPAITFEENSVNAKPLLLDADVTFLDAESNLDGGSLTLSGLLAEDIVSIRNQGTGDGEISLEGDVVSYGGTAIGTVSGGNGSTLTVTFNAAATSAAVEALIENLTYANTSDTPTATRNLTIDIVDAAGAHLGTAEPFVDADVGDASAPAFADLDGDGDLDAVVGDRYGTLSTFLNTGSATSPVFVQQTGAANLFDGVDVGVFASPAFADLDGDGDLDAVVGGLYGNLSTFLNTGNAKSAVFTEQTGEANPFDGVDIGGDSKPAFADLDGDGDLDAVVGEEYGTLRTFLNTGDATSPVFTEQTGEANPFDGVDVGKLSAPAFADLDGDGDLDAVVGEREGVLLTFLNTGDAKSPVFTEQTGAANPFDGVDVGIFSTPTFADLDGDGNLDVVVGEYDGFLNTFLDKGAASNVITVTVTPGDDAGVARDDSFTVAENATITTSNVFADNGSGADSDPDSDLAVSSVNGDGEAVGQQIRLDSGALLTLNADGSFAYDTNHAFDSLVGAETGASNSRASDTFTYAVGGTEATVTVTVTGISNGDLALLGTSKGDTLTGLGGNDTIDAQAGRDFLYGNAGADTLNGGSGNDWLVGGAGGDKLNGSTGFDVASYLGSNAGVKVNLETGVVSGGHAAGDVLSSIEGVRGSGYADVIVGNSANNWLAGASGNDTLTGGAGNDVFVFHTALGAKNVDRITDFSSAADTVKLDNAIFTAFSAIADGTAISAGAFNAGTGAQDDSDRIIYNAASGALLYDADGTGSTAAVQFATLSTGLTLTNEDFVII